MRLLLPLVALLGLAIAVDPVVQLKYGAYKGVRLENGLTQWLGIRYAAAPVGVLRFAAPQDPPFLEGVQLADKHGLICLATGDDPHEPTTSEDCLFLDVYAPSSATPDSKLPVYFFIQGGGFNSLSNANYNGSGLVTAADHQIVVVTVNYRVGLYGFLAGKQITDSKSAMLNNGLRDQRKALQWVQEYIRLFGGDPGKVVLGGDSAGAASIALHLTAFGGRDDGLFHGAAAESVSFATILTVEESQYQYDNLVERLGCAGGIVSPDRSITVTSGFSTLECLRSKSAPEIQSQNKNIPYPNAQHPPLFMWDPVLDNDLITSYTYAAFEQGKFLKIPVIFGDDTNGGTVFAPRNTSSLDQSKTFLHDQFPFLTQEHLDHISTLFPNKGHQFPNSGPWWRQASQAYGDIRYMCPSLFISAMFAQYGVDKNWNYRFNVQDPTLVASGLGVPHTVEISAIWGPENVHGAAPASFWPQHENAWVVPLIQRYWTSFIRTLDPNIYKLDGAPRWESFLAAGQNSDEGTVQRRFLFDTKTSSAMENVNEGVRERCRYLNEIGVAIRQ